MIPITDIEFPSVLPCAHREGYGLQARDTFRTTDLTSGRSISRRLFSFVPSEVRVQWVMNDIEASAFESFFRDALNDGVNWFNMELKTPRSPTDALVVKFKDMYEGPRLHQNGNRWVYTATLLTFERPIWPEPWGQVPDWIYNASRFDVLMNWVWPEDIPWFPKYP